MKKFIKKNWSLIGLIVAFLVDKTFVILDNSGLSHDQIDIIKGLGAIVSGYYWTTKHNEKILEDEFL